MPHQFPWNHLVLTDWRIKLLSFIASIQYCSYPEAISCIADFIRMWMLYKFPFNICLYSDFFNLQNPVRYWVYKILVYYASNEILKTEIKVSLSTFLFSWTISFFVCCTCKFNIIHRIHNVKKDKKVVAQNRNRNLLS